MQTTIAALATAPGTAALAIIRLSGPHAFRIAGSCLQKKTSFDNAGIRSCRLYRFVSADGQEDVDRVTAIKFAAPKSFTGEDMVEITCHGGEAVVQRVLQELSNAGACPAQKGEFTRRAFMNGKTDLAGAEAIQQMVESKTNAQLRCAVKNYLGGYEPKIEAWRKMATECLVDVESSVEFGQEDDIAARDLIMQAQNRAEQMLVEIERELSARQMLRQQGRSFRVALVGLPNSGKSTTMNLILGFSRAIVHSEAGTTRDIVSENVRIGEESISLIDTAGLREIMNDVEKEGVERALHMASTADIVALITAADQPISEIERELLNQRIERTNSIICLVNKTDLADGIAKIQEISSLDVATLGICALSDEERVKVVKFLTQAIKKGKRSESVETTMLGSIRQEKIAERVGNKLHAILEAKNEGEEILAVRLREVLSLLDEFEGKTSSEEILNAVFSTFCIGK
jgi:tRNA modification GTPase